MAELLHDGIWCDRHRYECAEVVLAKANASKGSSFTVTSCNPVTSTNAAGDSIEDAFAKISADISSSLSTASRTVQVINTSSLYILYCIVNEQINGLTNIGCKGMFLTANVIFDFYVIVEWRISIY